MTGRWAVCLPRESIAGLGRLRLVPRLSVCEHDEEVWLQGEGADEVLEAALRGLPGARRFSIFPDRQLLAAGSRVPHGYLPEGAWQPLKEWLQVTLEAAGLAGQVGERVSVCLVRSSTPREASVLLTTLDAWKTYGSSAPQVRLERWSFAVSDEEVIVRGMPLPPIPGQAFVERDGIAVPAGWDWDPPIDAGVLRDVLGLTAGDLALLRPPPPHPSPPPWRGREGENPPPAAGEGRVGVWDRVPADAFVRAVRSAIRLSGEENAHVG